MSKPYKIRVTRLTVLPEDEPIFSETATHIEIYDEAAGEFLKLSQQGGHVDSDKFLLITPDEWTPIKEAIETLMKELRP
jgi:hypothetical protein